MKRLWFAPVLLLTSGTLMAAERVEHTVQVTAQVPASTFYVEPVGNWLNTPQKLEFDPFSKTLATLTKQFDVKSTIGPVKGYLSHPATITSGKESINLKVMLAGVELTSTSAELVNQADANAGKQVGLEIIPAAAPTGGYKPGNYQGVVSMMFESEAPPAQGG